MIKFLEVIILAHRINSASADQDTEYLEENVTGHEKIKT